MARKERREQVALDEAYRFYKEVLSSDSTHHLHRLVNSLKTVNAAIVASEKGHLKITTRLWMRMRQALFDKLLTSFPNYLVVIQADGTPLAGGAPLPDDGMLEIHPDGLRRNDDCFSMEIKNLHPSTRNRVNKTWTEHGSVTRPSDFMEIDCSLEGVCAPKLFLLGDDVLQMEVKEGRQEAYQQWWDLYWRAYCTPDRNEKWRIGTQMASLEGIWGKPSIAS
ncbi:MAG TPA: hypothetical protein V6C72_01935 [Chroococcales cyanobacterium]